MAERAVPKEKQKGGRVVKSRYLQFDKKDVKKDASAKPLAKAATKPSCTTGPRSVLPQKCKTPAGAVSGSSDRSSLEQTVLQSTLLGEDKLSRPDLDLSTICGDKTIHVETPASESAWEGGSRTSRNPPRAGYNSDDLIQELESQTLLLTYLRVKAEKNLSELEKNAEQNLLKLCEEKQRQQEKLCKLKREILLREREQKLSEALDKQLKEQYKSFAVALDATRHELPTKDIHIEGDTQAYLDELQKQLAVTQGLLREVMPSFSGESAKACSALKELKEVSQELDEELQRSFTQVQNLSFEVSKEVSLHNQRVCEESHGLDVVRRWYFS